MIYFVALLSNKTLKNFCIINIKQVLHLIFLQPDDPHFHKRGYALALTKCFLRPKPTLN